MPASMLARVGAALKGVPTAKKPPPAAVIKTQKTEPVPKIAKTPAYTRAGVSQGLGPAPRRPPPRSRPGMLSRVVTYMTNYDPRIAPAKKKGK